MWIEQSQLEFASFPTNQNALTISLIWAVEFAQHDLNYIHSPASFI
jgi:hypothetical protein